MAESWKVVADKAARRDQPTRDGKVLNWAVKDDEVKGFRLTVAGVQWLKSSFKGPAGGDVECFMMVDGTSIGLPLLLERMDGGGAKVSDLSEVEAKVLEAAMVLCKAAKLGEGVLEFETDPKVKLALANSAMDSCMHKAMDMKFNKMMVEDGLKLSLEATKIDGDKADQAYAELMVARARLMKKQAENCMKAAKTARMTFKSLKNKEGEGAALMIMANSYLCKASRVMGGERAKEFEHILPEKIEDFKRLQEEMIEAAAQSAGEALKLRKKTGVLEEVDSMIKVAIVELGRKDAEKARELVDEAILICKANKMEQLEWKCIDLLLDCAEVHLKCEEFADAQDCASEAAAIYKWKNKKDLCAAALRMQIQIHTKANEGQWAISVAKELVKIYKDKGDFAKEAAAMHDLVNVYVSMGMGQDAEIVGREGVRLAQLAKDTKSMIAILSSVMSAYIADEERKDVQKAMAFAKEALNLAEDDEGTQAKAQLWIANLEIEKFFDNYEPLIAQWKDNTFQGSRDEKKLKLKDFKASMQKIVDSMNVFKQLGVEDEVNECAAYYNQHRERINRTMEPVRTEYVFKDGRHSHTVHTYDPEEAASLDAAAGISPDAISPGLVAYP